MLKSRVCVLVVLVPRLVHVSALLIRNASTLNSASCSPLCDSLPHAVVLLFVCLIHESLHMTTRLLPFRQQQKSLLARGELRSRAQRSDHTQNAAHWTTRQPLVAPGDVELGTIIATNAVCCNLFGRTTGDGQRDGRKTKARSTQQNC